jgi:hypothetical protein
LLLLAFGCGYSSTGGLATCCTLLCSADFQGRGVLVTEPGSSSFFVVLSELYTEKQRTDAAHTVKMYSNNRCLPFMSLLLLFIIALLLLLSCQYTAYKLPLE